jgi:hypothetical protein
MNQAAQIIYIVRTGEVYIWANGQRFHVCYIEPGITDNEELNQKLNEIINPESRDEPWSKSADWWKE